MMIYHVMCQSSPIQALLKEKANLGSWALQW